MKIAKNSIKPFFTFSSPLFVSKRLAHPTAHYYFISSPPPQNPIVKRLHFIKKEKTPLKFAKIFTIISNP